MKLMLRSGFSVLLVLASVFSLPSNAQDWVHTGSNLGNARIRLAAADFKPVGADPQTPTLKATFDSTLFSDLQNAGIFDMVSKSFNPQATPGSPQEINLSQWSTDPVNAAMVAFGALSANNGRLVVYGWLDDARNTANPQVLGKQYNEAASEDMASTAARRVRQRAAGAAPRRRRTPGARPRASPAVGSSGTPTPANPAPYR